MMGAMLCHDCENYAWHSQAPVYVLGVKHHPACRRLDVGGAVSVSGVHVGAPLFPSRDELMAYMNREKLAFESLEADMYRNLVWDDPDALRARAKTFRDLAADPPLGVDPGKYASAQNAAADAIESDADVLEKRENAKGVKESTEEKAWSLAYRDMMRRWQEFYDEISGETYFDRNSAWGTTDSFDAEYRQDYALYGKNFGTPSRPLPPTPEQIEAQHVDPNAFPWTLMFGSVAAVAAAVVIWKVL